MHEHEHGLDPQGRLRLPGIYSAIVVAINDPLKKNRVKVSVHQVTGSEISNWAEACLPVTSNAIHPNHLPHTGTFTTSGAKGHAHSVSVTFNSHAHVASTDPQETDTLHDHTAHRNLPKMGQLVWVMFIAGDPNFPVWIGVQS